MADQCIGREWLTKDFGHTGRVRQCTQDFGHEGNCTPGEWEEIDYFPFAILRPTSATEKK
jgi:hypothetical protein